MNDKGVQGDGSAMAAQTVELLKNGENSRVEFKRCSGSIGNDVMETVCAFLNRLAEISFWAWKTTELSSAYRKKLHRVCRGSL